MDNVKGESYFLRTNEKPKQYEYLTNDIKTDVIIIGGGVTGCITAYYFKKAGIDVTLLEKQQIASGSTSITTSILQYELDSNLQALTKTTTYDNVIKSYKLCQKALTEIDNFILEHGNNCNYKKRDCLLYSSKKCEIEELKAEYQIRKDNGFDVKFYDEQTNIFPFDLKAGIYSINGGAEFDPYLFTHQLAQEIINRDGKIFENTEAIKVDYTDENVIVTTSLGHKVEGKIIIVATGYSIDLFTKRKFGTKTCSFNVVTKPLDEFKGWHNGALIRDNNSIYTYLRTTDDNRIIIGGEDVEVNQGLNHEDIAEEKYDILLSRLKAMFPQINNIEAEYKYCGTFASTKDNVGFIGKDKENEKLWYCLGYGANGILFAVLGGMFLSKLYKGEPDNDMELFSIDRFDKK